MSVVSESVGSEVRHGCMLCGECLTGKRIVAGGDGDYCEPCAREITTGAARPPVMKADPAFRPWPIDPY